MSDLGHVLVLAGGLSYEREVSIRSGRRVAEVLRAQGVDVETRDTDSTLVPTVLSDRPTVVFVTLHGGAGEDGAIRSVLELLGVPYVGAAPDACRVAFDKPTAKAVVRSWGLNTPDSVALPKETFHDLGASAVLSRIVESLGLPLVREAFSGWVCAGGVHRAVGGGVAGGDGGVFRVRGHGAHRDLRRRGGGGGVRLSTWGTGLWRCLRWRSCPMAGLTITRPGTRRGGRSSSRLLGWGMRPWRRARRWLWRRTRRWGCGTCRGLTSSWIATGSRGSLR